METLGRKASVMREAHPERFTLTAAIHSARSWAAKLLHSRRTEGWEQRGRAVTDCPSKVTAARARLVKRWMSILVEIARMGREEVVEPDSLLI